MYPSRARESTIDITPDEIRSELQTVLGSPEFERCPQLQRFLNFVVEEELAGRGAQLKEYVLAVGVFGRPADFDPRLDSLVRVEARRLRATLEKYYDEGSRADPIRIELQKGSYLPSFRRAEVASPSVVRPTTDRAQGNISAIAKWLTHSFGRVGLGVAFLVLVAGGASLVFRLRHAQALTERDSVVLAEFANSTGDPVFDETLKQGLAMELEQSPFLNILSDRRTAQVLKLMGQSAAAHLNQDLGREVCLRSGSKAMVTGSIGRLGNQYVIGLTATNCATGDAFAHLQAEAKNKETVLNALGTAAARLRGKLGESLSSVQRFDAPIEEATTPSLEALQAYGLGRRMAREKGSPADIPYYKLAIELDPKFAVAYAALGVSYVNLGQPSMATDYVRKAYELRERVSEREKYRISAYYYHVVTGELDKWIETYEAWKQSYPRDFAPYINLGLGYTWMGQYEKCAAETKEALRLEPNNVLPYSNLAASYIKLGRLQDAETVLSEARARNLTSKFLRSNLGYLAFLRNDVATMEKQLAEVKDKAGDEDPLLSQQSDTDAYYGRLKRAREFSERAVDSAARSQAKEAAAGWLVNSALREAEFGNAAAARKDVHESLRLSTGRDVIVLAALALARAGDADGAQRLAGDLEREYPTNTFIRSYWLPTIQAAFEIRKHNPKQAIGLLQPVLPYELGSPPPMGLATLYPVYLRGEAYLIAGQGAMAAGEFQKILDHPGLVLNFPLHALAYRELGKARALAQDQAGARQAYEEFLALWKDADPDIPALQEAKTEYARMQ
jgi:tetratricopeptide (TPR) repeat protein